MVDLGKGRRGALARNDLAYFLAQVAGDRDAVPGMPVGVVNALDAPGMRHQVKGDTQLAGPRMSDDGAGQLREEFYHALAHHARTLDQIETCGQVVPAINSMRPSGVRRK